MTAPISANYRVGLAAWAALALLQLAWHGWLFPAQSMPAGVALGITVVPLLLPLFALRDVRRALLWVGILSLFYFCHGVSEAWSAPGERWLAWIEILLTLTLIGMLGLGVRRKRAASNR
ncbi:Uncharacterized membrane protein [Dyella jiangningensis]|uniref:DUF2069 domain-containing protein n=1 Tax=Dyella sp. AtDHG13 TaxID=1938897 RepID=UPI000890C745|nr:DUF2069 domain-containing protein [Dyella sp. AtDHG13]PXV58750.1 putative membrane protein [Dyella sp. AtDHG13]SDJ84248.1 Uncharacterized membrane protein [Dyella jiangningensis]